jgi:hypothetical protein
VVGPSGVGSGVAGSDVAASSVARAVTDGKTVGLSVNVGPTDAGAIAGPPAAGAPGEQRD